MSKRETLTDLQKYVMRFIISTYEETSQVPTIPEISKALANKGRSGPNPSVNTGAHYLEALTRKGYVSVLDEGNQRAKNYRIELDADGNPYTPIQSPNPMMQTWMHAQSELLMALLAIGWEEDAIRLALERTTPTTRERFRRALDSIRS
jgi:hypothetical protein